MILVPFLAVVLAVLYVLLSPLLILNDVSLDGGLTSTIVTAAHWVYSFDQFFPVHETIAIFLGVFVAYEVAYFVLKIANFIIRKIPTIS